MKNGMAYIGMAVFLSIMLGMSSASALNAPASSVVIESNDPVGDVVDMLNNTPYDDPSIDIVHGSVDMDSNEVIVDLQVSGSIDTTSDSVLYIVNIYDSGGDYVSFSYSAGVLSKGIDEISSSYFHASGATLELYPPYSYFAEISDVYKVEMAAYSENMQYADSLIFYQSSGGGGSGNGGIIDPTDVMVQGHSPDTETPTDVDITLRVTYAHIEIKVRGDTVEYDYTARGTSNGASEIWVSSGAHYTDGGWNWGGFWIKGPFEYPDNSEDAYGKHYYQFYLKGDESGSLSTWEFRMHYTSQKQGNPDFSMDRMRIYVRGYSASGNWNEVHRDLNVRTNADGTEVTAGTDVSSSSGSDTETPGFEAGVAIAAMSVSLILWERRRKH